MRFWCCSSLTRYVSRGIVFDDIFAWEPVRPRSEGALGDAFKNIPEGALGALHFIPVGVTAEVGHRFNPLTLIRERCKPGDLVVFKLDIGGAIQNLLHRKPPTVSNDIRFACSPDSEATELALTQQLIESEELLALVDEFYFEMHCCTDVMAMHGMACTEISQKTVSSWYDMAIPARKKGMRVHYWP